MLVSTSDIVPTDKTVQILGLVRGNIVTSKNIGRDIMASAKTLVGGEIKSYSEMTNEARQIAENRMIAEAEKLGADGIISMRFSSNTVMQGTIEMLAYGTAVKFV
ncbi:YbjQ family protein [Phoenicibacter congonensis]|uniref:YbjQ family protein n=1 Tax=Phoenicibacter congonensis TaxID=1944646 RepID=UPI0009A661AB|nr:YbjQ family protein [Phoenicibacter congonensis]